MEFGNRVAVAAPLRAWLVPTLVLLSFAGAVSGLEPSAAQAQNLTPEEQAAQVLNSANKAFNERQANAAADRFREYLQKFGNQPGANQARYGLALALLELAQPDFKTAAETLTPVVGVQDFPQRAESLYYLAVAYRGLGLSELAQGVAKPNEMPQRRQAAVQQFTQAATRFGESHAVFAARAKAAPAAANGEPSADAEWANRARCDQAEMLVRSDKPKEANELIGPWLADATNAKSRYRPLGLYLHGSAAFQLNDYPTAVRVLSQLAPFADPVFGVQAQYLLARTHHLNSERAEAAVLYESVIAGYEKQKAAAQQSLQQNAAALQQQPEERTRLETLVKQQPDHVTRTHFYWAVLLHEQQKPGDALAKLTLFLQQNPQSPLVDEAKLRSGMCLVETRQFGPAQQLLQPLAQHAQFGDRALLWLARSQIGAADPNQPQPYQQAVTTAVGTLGQAADRANQAAGQDPDAKRRRAEILLEQGDWQQVIGQYAQAAGSFETALRENLAPDRAEEFLQRRATALHMAGQYDPSDQVCVQFQQAYPKSSLLPAVLFRYAENAFVRAAAIEPNVPLSKNADLLKWLAEAGKRYQALVEKYPEFPYVPLARFRWALTYYRQGDFAKALALLQQIPASDQSGELATAPYYLADCLLRDMPAAGADALAAARQVQVLTDAAKLLDSFVSNQGPDPQKALPQTADALLKLGYCHQKMAAQLADPKERAAKLAAARQVFERIAQQFPASPALPMSVLERANVMVEQNDVNGAINELNRFKGDPLRATPVAPLGWLRLASLLRTQNKSAEAATLLQDARNQFEGALAADPQRASWAPLLAYHHALAVKETGKLVDAQKLFEAAAQKYAAAPEGPEAAWRAGQCRREDAVLRLAAARLVLSRADAKPEEIQAATAQVQDVVKTLGEAAQFLVQQAGTVAQKAAGSETHQRLVYETAWCYQGLADLEIEATRKKLADEALKKWQEEQAKLAASTGGATPPVAAPNPAGAAVGLQRVPQQRVPEIPWSAIPVQPSEQAAQTHYKSLISLASESPLAILARLELAEMLARRGDHDPALALLSDALTLEPASDVEDRIRLRLGASLLGKKDAANAFAQFAAVAQNAASPWAAEARYRAGECQMQLQAWPKAIETWIPFRDQQPLQNVPGLSDRALLRLGHALALAGQWDQSRQCHETLVQRFPQSPWRYEARYGVAWAWHNQKQLEQAAQNYSQVINETASEVAAKAQYQYAMCRVEQRRLPEAASALLAVPFTYDYPEWSATALLEASRVFEEMKQPPQARRLLERLLKDYPDTDWAKAAQQRLTQLQTGGKP